MMGDDLVALFAAHQKAGTITDACICGAGDRDTLCESGTATNRHWRHLALVVERHVRERDQ